MNRGQECSKLIVRPVIYGAITHKKGGPHNAGGGIAPPLSRMREKIDLSTAKAVLKEDAVFLSRNGFTLYDSGKYRPNITLEMTDRWVITPSWNNTTEYVSPYQYLTMKKYTDGMNMMWNGKAEVLFGNYHKSQKGNPVLTLCDPEKAKHVLVRVDWEHSGGMSSASAEAQSSLYFRIAASNGGRTGYDYYILPVGHVLGHPERDVTEFLKEASETIKNVEREGEAKFAEARKQQQEKDDNKAMYQDLVIKKYDELVKAAKASSVEIIEEYYGKEPEILKYALRAKGGNDRYPFNQTGVAMLDGAIQDIQRLKENYYQYIPKYDALNGAFEELGYKPAGEYLSSIAQSTMQVYRMYQKTDGGTRKWDVPFTPQGYQETIGALDRLQKERKQEDLELMQKEMAVIKAAKDMAADRIGRESNCPQNLTYYHREGGASGQSKMVVLEGTGEVRPCTTATLRNKNHYRHFSSVEEAHNIADGTQCWKQIRKDEAVITFNKPTSNSPLIMGIMWTPEGGFSPAQRDSIPEVLQEMLDQYDVDHAVIGGYRSDDNITIKTVRPETVDMVLDEHVATEFLTERIAMAARQTEIATDQYNLHPIFDRQGNPEYLVDYDNKLYASLNHDGSLKETMDGSTTADMSVFVTRNDISCEYEVIDRSDPVEAVREQDPLAQLRDSEIATPIFDNKDAETVYSDRDDTSGGLRALIESAMQQSRADNAARTAKQGRSAARRQTDSIVL